MATQRTLKRFEKKADADTKRTFGRDLIQALDEIGVQPGDEFVVVKVNGQPSLLDDPSENQLGAFSRDSDTSRQAALDNYPRSGTQRMRVLDAIARAPNGLTREEVSIQLGITDSGCDGRVKELRDGEFVEDHHLGTKRRTKAGSEAMVQVLTVKGITEWRKRQETT